MMDYGSGWGVGLGWLVMILVIALVVLGVWALARGGDGPGRHDEAGSILRTRLARGEITPEEYERLRTTLGVSEPSTAAGHRGWGPLAVVGVILAILLVVALVAALLWGGRWGPRGFGWMGSMMGWTAAVPYASPVAADTVQISGNAFVPANVAIRAGTTVTWRNDDQVEHTVSAIDRSWSSDDLALGARFQRTFTSAGSFGCFCLDHPWMRGIVSVS